MKKRQGKIASGKCGKRQAVDRSLHPVVRRKYRVYRAFDPMNVDGTAYSGKYPEQCGWYWIRYGISLPIKVFGLENARWVARVLNQANPRGQGLRSNTLDPVVGGPND